MKTKRNRLIGALAIALLIGAAIFGSIAYLQDTSAVQNNVIAMGSKLDVDLNEAKVNEYGEPINDSGTVVAVTAAPRVTANAYKIIPNHTFVKDPTLTVTADSEPCYVRLLVTINKATEFEALATKYSAQDLKLEDIFNRDNPWNWAKIGGPAIDPTANTATYEFRYRDGNYEDASGNVNKNIVDARAETQVLQPLFNSFTIPAYFDNADVTSLGGLQINVVGHAIQAMDFAADGAKTAEEVAWEAFAGAQASVPPVTVTFDLNGKTGAAPTAISAPSGTTILKPADPTVDGCTFDGWYKDAACTAGNEWNFDAYIVTADTTLYAKWTDNETTP